LAEHLTKVKNRLNEMLIEQRTRPAGWQFALNAHFMLIVSDLSRAYSEQDNPVMRSLTRLGDVISYVHRNYAQNMTLDDLAKVANMSTRTLTREFKNALGISPIDYLIRERVNRAMDLLRYSDITITEAAYRVGFADGSYFTRKFHALVGHSPREARRLKMT
jgi:transcriptional regulator GlxA family with amidase domain